MVHMGKVKVLAHVFVELRLYPSVSVPGHFGSSFMQGYKKPGSAMAWRPNLYGGWMTPHCPNSGWAWMDYNAMNQTGARSWTTASSSATAVRRLLVRLLREKGRR
eukprot:2571233-Amphidinium_carterae.1